MNSAARKPDLHAGKVAEDVRWFAFIHPAYLEGFTVLAAILLRLRQDFRLKGAQASKTGRRLPRDVIALLSCWHDTGVVRTTCNKQRARNNQQFFTCSHLFAPSRIGGGAQKLRARSSCKLLHAHGEGKTRACVVCVVSTPFLRKYLYTYIRKVT